MDAVGLANVEAPTVARERAVECLVDLMTDPVFGNHVVSGSLQLGQTVRVDDVVLDGPT